MVRHAGWVLARKESARDALAGLSRDTAKLKRTLTGPKTPQRRKQAVGLAKQGRRAYNQKEHAQAENHFREALVCDPDYPLAHLYLGHTLYQMGRIEEAVRSWEKVMAVAPGSKEAGRAERKIGHVGRRTGDVVDHLAERLGMK